MNKVQIARSRLVAIFLVPCIVLAQNTDASTPNQFKSEIESLEMQVNVKLTELDNTQVEELEDTSQDYTLQEIHHAFDVMEPFVIYDENKNIKFDISATKDPNVTQKDIDVALDFTIHNNAIMNATVGSVGKVNELGTNNMELKLALKDLQTGKFKALFANSGAIGSTNDITPVSYDYVQTPIVTVFGIDSIVPVHHGAWLTVCGGGFNDPHKPDTYPDNYRGSGTLSATQSELKRAGYHMVDVYASWTGTTSQPYDFAKVTPSSQYSGLCDLGAFRDQAIIDPPNFSYRVFEYEPNPEVIRYVWPALWWGPYVAWWHDNY